MSQRNSSPEKPLALENFSGDLFVLDDGLIARGCKAARESARKRIIFPIQRTQDDLVQRLINFLQPGTYIRPHFHPMKHATESILIMQGSLIFQTFDDMGEVQERIILKAGTFSCLIDIVPGICHNFVVTEADTVIAEFKKGPYDAATDKQFASWSPDEGTEQAREYLQKWTNEL
ncbi:MAG: WbuC family cupin fold metalloprotein [Balneolales bacterium]|nr:WbuC family cupin fold metalloprotein [Balneolales bacterium]